VKGAKGAKEFLEKRITRRREEEKEKRLVPFFFLGDLCSFAALREIFCRNFLEKRITRRRRGTKGREEGEEEGRKVFTTEMCVGRER